MFKTKKAKRECYNRNNARNRDILTREQAQNAMNYLEDIRSKENNIVASNEYNEEAETSWDLVSEELPNLNDPGNNPDDNSGPLD